ncbi:MAG: cytidine deaminase [Ignavibacteria bacterium]|nr:cytidine deaminase [Bacteroidota bacterium]MSQ46220.1 cytidine deaminase [Ignavibacteria bacterium]
MSNLFNEKLKKINMKLNKDLILKLATSAVEAKNNSYSPYSKFRVGAALLCNNGEIIPGCNIENLSYSLTTCAERTAIFSAINSGKKIFSAIAITSDDKNFITPCGACLQVISEFAPKIKIILVRPDGKIKLTSLLKLFPSPPDLKFLAKK